MQCGMANPACVLIMENNLHILRLARWLATEEINCGARITFDGDDNIELPSIIAIQRDYLDKIRAREIVAPSALCFYLEPTMTVDSPRKPKLIPKLYDSVRIMTRSRAQKMRPICLNVSGVKRGAVLVAHPPRTRCALLPLPILVNVIAPCNLSW